MSNRSKAESTLGSGKDSGAFSEADLRRAERLANVRVELLRLGVGRSQIEELVRRYPIEQIELQLEWLPYRRPRKPASLIVAAIRDGFDEPAALTPPSSSDSSSSDSIAHEGSQE